MVFLQHLSRYTGDFVFSKLNSEKPDAIVVYNPSDTFETHGCHGHLLHSTHSLEEHITLINTQKIKKAIVIAENISFLHACPGLEYLSIIPSHTCRKFDFSPLYAMTNLKWLFLVTAFGPDDKKFAHVDCSKLSNVRRLSVDGKQKEFFADGLCNLRSLFLHSGAFHHENLDVLHDCTNIRNLWFTQDPICSLSGIEQLTSLKRLELDLCSKLEDISALASCGETLTWLTIQSCNKIKDFSVLSKLKNLEYLTIKGNNAIPNLSFIKQMPNLKQLLFTIKVEDGDLSYCEGIPYVHFVDRRHYSHKSKDFPKTSSIKKHLFYYEDE